MNRSDHARGFLALIVAAAIATPASADPAAERAATLANTTCAACHGANGLSISETIPNLAGQRAGYLENQLKALREGSRKSGVMNAIAEAPEISPSLVLKSPLIERIFGSSGKIFKLASSNSYACESQSLRTSVAL